MIPQRVLTDKRHLLWPLLVAVIANAALLVLVLYPLSQQVSGGVLQAQSAATRLDGARKDYAAARATVTGKETADKALQQFYSSVLPPDFSDARRTLGKVDQLLARFNLRPGGSRMRPIELRDSHLAKMGIEMDCSGNYADVRRFIHAIETSPEFLVIENVQLSQEAEGKTALKVSVQIGTYYRAGGDGN